MLPLYWVDAFTDRLFSGNPAAVVPLEAWLEDGRLQRIAFENGLAETAFFVRTGPARYAIRWLTPEAEVDLCGHATLASAFVLFQCLGVEDEQVTFESRSGPLTVARRPDRKIELDFPARRGDRAEPPQALVRGLGATPLEFVRAQANLAVFATAAEVRAIAPDFAALATLEEYGTIVTAPGEDCDFVSRFFAPAVGVPEDAVTGSAHCMLAPYWGARLGKTSLHARQLSRRGGELWCEVAGDRVKLAGDAVLYLEGRVHA